MPAMAAIRIGAAALPRRIAPILGLGPAAAAAAGGQAGGFRDSFQLNPVLL